MRMNGISLQSNPELALWSYLWGHSADCRHIIASIEEVWGVLLQLKLTQPLIDCLCILTAIKTWHEGSKHDAWLNCCYMTLLIKHFFLNSAEYKTSCRASCRMLHHLFIFYLPNKNMFRLVVFWPCPLAAVEDAQTAERNPALQPSAWAAQVYEELLQKNNMHTYLIYNIYTRIHLTVFSMSLNQLVFLWFLVDVWPQFSSSSYRCPSRET